MKTKNVKFPSSELSLVGIIYIPDGIGRFPAVVVCHPHPQYGGSMNNNVVNSLCKALVARSIIAFKFNFRGVDGSDGSFGQGIGEQEDVKSAITYIGNLAEVDFSRIGLAGYSAGSAWGLTAGCQDTRIKVMAAVSPPLSMFNFQCLQDCFKPKLLVSGSEDELIPVKLFERFCQSLPEPKEYQSIGGADHSWWGYESELSEKVSGFFSNRL